MVFSESYFVQFSKKFLKANVENSLVPVDLHWGWGKLRTSREVC